MPKVSQAYLDARREQILEAAYGCFLESGFVATQMREVAARAGVSTGVLYRYFAGKEDLYRATIQWARPGEEEFRRQTFGVEGPAIDRIVQLPGRLIELVRTNELVTRRNFRDFGEAAMIEFVAEGLRQMVADVTDDLEALVRQAQEDGDLRPDLDPVMTASWLTLQWVGIGFVRLFGPGFDTESLRQTMEAAISGLRLDEGTDPSG